MSVQRILACLALIVVCALCFPRRSVIGDEWLPITPEELKMTSEPKAPGAPAIYLYRQVDRDDKSTASSEYNYVRIKILTEEGRKYANVEIRFEKGQYKVNGINARTIHPDGSIVKWDGKVYENTIVKSKSLKYLAKTFSMPDVTVGSIIEYQWSYNFEDYSLFNSRWLLSDELFIKYAKFSLKPFSNEGWSVQWVSPAGLPVDTQPAKEGPDHIIRMEARNIPAFQTEDFMPPENELKFRVDFIYREGAVEMNPDKYWANFGKKQAGLVEEFVNKRKAMEQAVSQIVSPNDPPMVKLQKIYARTQQIRNLSYEEEKTEQQAKREKLKAASNVEELWKNQYGYGYYITWLFLGLARAAGFEAYPCLVASRGQYFFRKDRLNSRELSSNVVLVKLDGKEMFFDPGALSAPFGLLPWQESAVAGLKLDKDGGKWINTPLPESDSSHVERKGSLHLDDDGTLDGTLTFTWTGLSAMSRRVSERNEDEASRKKFLEDEVKASIPIGAEVDLTNQPAWNGSDSPLVAQFNLKVQGFASSAGRKALLPATLFSADEQHLFEHADRVYAAYFEFPFKKIDDITVDLPLVWKIASLPSPVDTDAKAIAYKLSAADSKGQLHLQRELRSDLMIVPTTNYGTLRSFYQFVRSQDAQQIVVLPGGAAASQ